MLDCYGIGATQVVNQTTECLLFVLGYSEGATFVFYGSTELGEGVGEGFGFWCGVREVAKDIAFFTVAMEVDDILDLELLFDFLDPGGDDEGLVAEAFINLHPLTVDVDALEIQSWISVDDTIRIDHWNEEKSVIVPTLNNTYMSYRAMLPSLTR